MKLTFNARLTLFLTVCILSLAACNNAGTKSSGTSPMTDSTTATLPPAKGFEQIIDGKQTHYYTLKNEKLKDLVIGFDAIDDYKTTLSSYYGATIGRYGNRIAKGHFVLDGRRFDLFINNKPNTLHGGKKGYNDVVWETKQVTDSTITFTYLSKDMEEGYPGNLQCQVTYALTPDNAVKISYEATTDKNTVVNLTNHSYFNLNGIGSGTILNHVVEFKAAHYTPIDPTSITTGKIDAVAGTPFDFTKPATIGSRIGDQNEQLKNGSGYDHNFVLDQHD